MYVLEFRRSLLSAPSEWGRVTVRFIVSGFACQRLYTEVKREKTGDAAPGGAKVPGIGHGSR